MAIKATIYKVKLEISDCDRNYFHSHDLTVSCHPSETQQRMMIRQMAFAIYASDSLSFTKGLCADDEPELWDKNLSGEIEQWISLGQIDEKQLRKSLGRSKKVIIFTYAGQKSATWWRIMFSTQFRKMFRTGRDRTRGISFITLKFTVTVHLTCFRYVKCITSWHVLYLANSGGLITAANRGI